MRKIIIFLILILFSINNALAIDEVIFNVNDVINTETKTYLGLTSAKINLVDSGDAITALKVTAIPNNNTFAYFLTFNNNVTYYVKYTEYTELYVFPYLQQNVYLTVPNSSNTSQLYLVYSDIKKQSLTEKLLGVFISPKTEIYYDKVTNENIFMTYMSVNVGNQTKFTTNKSFGLPVQILKISSTVPIDLEITMEDWELSQSLIDLKNQLSGISRFIYDALTLEGLLGESELLLNILILFDILFDIISSIFILIFVYPYLILLYVLILINFKTSYESITIRDFVLNYGENIKQTGRLFITLGTMLWYILIRIVEGIVQVLAYLRQLIPII